MTLLLGLEPFLMLWSLDQAEQKLFPIIHRISWKTQKKNTKPRIFEVLIQLWFVQAYARPNRNFFHSTPVNATHNLQITPKNDFKWVLKIRFYRGLDNMYVYMSLIYLMRPWTSTNAKNVQTSRVNYISKISKNEPIQHIYVKSVYSTPQY